MSDPPAQAGDAREQETSLGGRQAGLSRSYLVTFGGSVGALVLNLFTGIVSARLLGPDGRGVVGAISAWVMIVALLGNLGMRDGLSYLESRDHRRAPAILSLAVVSVVALGAASVVLAELLLPIGFQAQTDEAIRYARLFMLWVLPFMACNVFIGLFGARQRFLATTMMRVGQPLLYAVGLGALWAGGSVSVVEVLVVQTASFSIVAAGAFVALCHESGMGVVDPSLGREGWSYGIRSFGSSIGTLTNSRLDQLVLPAVVSARQIGLYVVAVRAASMVVGLFGSLSAVLFPVTARAGGRSAVPVIQRSIRLVSVLALLGSALLAVVARPAVVLLYGSEFSGSVSPLRLLLPGVVFWASSQMITGALKGLNHPVAGSVIQFVGVGVTVVGLALTLPTLGIDGAAITSSVSYAVVFILGIVQVARITETKVSATLSLGALRDDVPWLLERLRGGRGRPARREPATSAHAD